MWPHQLFGTINTLSVRPSPRLWGRVECREASINHHGFLVERHGLRFKGDVWLGA
jgi:hypothetical protein